MNPNVSIILPSLNVANYIKKCMDSVVNQTLKEIEIICVDAGSTDGTYEILMKYAQADERIVLLNSAEKSYGKQVNIGIKAARSRYVAIVETDDFIEDEMYERLYSLAEKKDVDYAKANYDSFITLDSEELICITCSLFPEKSDCYEKVLNPRDVLKLFENDNAIWKGIYKRDFLLKNNIYFNETPGAAFQDIGFMLQVLCKAQRAVYTNQSFYRYRRDREEASSNSSNGLQYAYQEFKRLLDMHIIEVDSISSHTKGFFLRMVGAFLCEIDKTLKYYDYSVEAEKIGTLQECYEWFCDKLKEAIKHGALNRSLCSEKVWFSLNLLLRSLQGYADYAYVQYRISLEIETELLMKVRQKRIIIFGSGIRGHRAYELFYKEGLEIVAFCDNDERKWGNRIGDVEVKSLMECMELYGDAMFVIASKRYVGEIQEQLLDCNVKKEDIQVFD